MRICVWSMEARMTALTTLLNATKAGQSSALLVLLALFRRVAEHLRRLALAGVALARATSLAEGDRDARVRGVTWPSYPCARGSS